MFQKIKVLLVDDDEIQEILVKAKLQEIAEIHYVRSAREALPIIDSQLDRYNLIISDIEMPLMSGLDLALYVREVVKSDICMIAHTASLNTNEKFYIKNGFNGFLPKGFEMQDFMKLWEKIQLRNAEVSF
ncbi:MAG: response regulator [Raineya sp.]|nr:response regulator [Raineya sp.]